ncbi:Outer membrane protein OmpA [Ekhidna lutea]|uniref:Outer membrane protein OmpA n=1 Tax=Ekhidna lutea TaxID=447679 RepID=A0A239JW24_EKHLU|nr:OmpA family protein [Ekhidna lutea]SNT10136.1 Outer membrane protein OmpA [Ekhidna lutea]
MGKLGIYLVLNLICFLLIAQGKTALDLIKGDRVIGNEYFDRMDYRNAIIHYQKTLNKHPDDTEVKFKIAQSYLKLNEPANSEIWLRSLVSYSDASKEMIYLYAEVLMRNGKLDQAKTWYENTLRKSWDAATASKINFIGQIDSYRKASQYKVENLDINSELADFAIHPFSEGMIFLSSRQVLNYIQYQPANAAREDEGMIRFFIKQDNSEISPLVYSEEVKPFYHDGPFSFYMDGNMVAFTRNDLSTKTKDHGLVKLKIFFADCSDLKAWRNIVPFEHNDRKYSVGHPALSNDGKTLIFSSDMPGGNGKADLYICYREGDSWTKPVNLGPEVNTSGAELFPYLHNDTTLYFSSTGLGGFGGLDMFKAKLKGSEAKEPLNLGQPLNSFSDDFSIYLNENGSSGYFSSNRVGGKGLDDIYAFQSTSASLIVRLTQSSNQPISDVRVEISSKANDFKQSNTSNESGYLQFDVPFDNDFRINVEDNYYYASDSILYSNKNADLITDTLLIKLEKHQLITQGLISNKETTPISNALVILENKNKKMVDSVRTNAEGAYSFQIEPENNYTIAASSDGYYTGRINFNTVNIYSGSIVNNIVLEDSIVKPVLYNLFIQGRLFSNESHELLPGALVLLDNISAGIRDSVRTTTEGTYSFRLKPDQQYKITALEDGFIPNGYSISTHDLYEGLLLNDILLEEEYEDKLIVFFDFNARELNNSYEESLQKMLKILSENPRSTLKITAHADTRGSADYNKQLSIDRLNSVKQYFIQRGISADRLEGISFGEELPLNQCSSGVDCPEEDHSQNRRAELKVQM